MDQFSWQWGSISTPDRSGIFLRCFTYCLPPASVFRWRARGAMRETQAESRPNSQLTQTPEQLRDAERVRVERHGSKCWTGWADDIPADRWQIYRRVMRAADARKIPFALAGAFATATHTGRWRDTNDMDLYTLPQHRQDMKEIIEG